MLQYVAYVAATQGRDVFSICMCGCSSVNLCAVCLSFNLLPVSTLFSVQSSVKYIGIVVFLALMLLRSVDSGCHLWEPLGTLFLLIKCDQVLLSISKARNDLPAVDTQAQEIFYSCFPLDVDYS